MWNCLTSWGTARLFSKVTTPFYIPTSTIWGFQFPHLLANTSHCQPFYAKHSSVCERDILQWLAVRLWQVHGFRKGAQGWGREEVMKRKGIELQTPVLQHVVVACWRLVILVYTEDLHWEIARDEIGNSIRGETARRKTEDPAGWFNTYREFYDGSVAIGGWFVLGEIQQMLEALRM